MAVKIDELLKENKVTLFVFHSQQWERDGFYFPDLRTIYVSAALSNADRERVILHELGHINHNPVNYSRCLLQYENQADRFMSGNCLRNTSASTTQTTSTGSTLLRPTRLLPVGVSR